MAFDVNDALNAPIDDGRNRFPVTHFKGHCTAIEGQVTKFGKDANAREQEQIVFKHENCEVIESREPFTNSEINLTLPYSNREGSTWVVTRRSIESWVQPDANGKRNIYDIVGRDLEWKMLPGMYNQPVRDESGNVVKQSNGRDKFEIQQGLVFQLVGASGLSSAADSKTTIWDAAAELLSSPLTEAEFHQKLFTAPNLQGLNGHSEAIQMATKRELLGTLQSMNKVKADGDKWVKV